MFVDHHTNERERCQPSTHTTSVPTRTHTTHPAPTINPHTLTYSFCVGSMVVDSPPSVALSDQRLVVPLPLWHALQLLHQVLHIPEPHRIPR